jgi:hypothetical protein
MRNALARYILLASLLAAAPGAAQGVDADVAKIHACVERNVPRAGRQEMRLEMHDSSGTRTLEAVACWKSDEQGRTRLLYRINAPTDVRGSAFLFRERDGAHDIWSYLPELRTVRRVTARGESVPFFGSDFTYEDVLELQAEARYARIERRPDTELDGRPVNVISHDRLSKGLGTARASRSSMPRRASRCASPSMIAPVRW